MRIGKEQKILIEAVQNNTNATKFLIKCVLERAQKVLMIDANSSQLKYDHNKEKAVGHILISLEGFLRLFAKPLPWLFWFDGSAWGWVTFLSANSSDPK